MNRIPIGAFVQVNEKGTDDTFNNNFSGCTGTVKYHNTNGMTGNTEENPLYVIDFGNEHKEAFWREELTLLY